MRCISEGADIRGAVVGGKVQSETETKGLQWKN